MQIMYKELTFLKQIGEGSFGRVYMARWRETTVAVKVLGRFAPGFFLSHREKQLAAGLLIRCHACVCRCCTGRPAIIWTMMTCRWTPAHRLGPQTPSSMRCRRWELPAGWQAAPPSL
jgi:serine/threonine protein kinase